MKNIKSIICSLLIYSIVACVSPYTCNVIRVDLKEKMSIDSVTNYLHFDNLIRIPMHDYPVSSVDRMIRCDSYVYILDKSQSIVYKIDTSAKKIKKIIDNKGRAKNEYIEITDIAIDRSKNLYVYDCESEKVNIYDAEGNYLRSIKNVAYGSSIAVANNNNFAINSNYLEDDLIIVYSPTGKELYRLSPQNRVTNHIFGDVASITSWNEEFIFTTPFDFNIYQTDNSKCVSMVSLDYGENGFDTDMLKGIDYKRFREVLHNNTNKIMSLRYLSQYKDYLFLSTEKNDQLIYNLTNNTIIELSNIEWPYRILFFSPMFVNKSGQFCSVVTNSNIKNGYLPSVEYQGTKLPQLEISLSDGDTDENTLWILMGRII